MDITHASDLINFAFLSSYFHTIERYTSFLAIPLLPTTNSTLAMTMALELLVMRSVYAQLVAGDGNLTGSQHTFLMSNGKIPSACSLT